METLNFSIEDVREDLYAVCEVHADARGRAKRPLRGSAALGQATAWLKAGPGLTHGVA